MVAQLLLTYDRQILQLRVGAHIAQDVQTINFWHHKVLQDTPCQHSMH